MKLLSCLVFCVLALVTASTADTTWVASGNVSGTWTSSGSPYMIHTGDITVASGTSLTINPGVTVYFSGQFKLVVNGQLLAIGTETDSIFFTGSDADFPQDTPLRWKGLRFVNAEGTSRLSYCSIAHGGATGAGILSNGGGLYCLNSMLHIDHSWIRRCHAKGVGCGSYFEGGTILLEYTNITNNIFTLIDPDIGNFQGDVAGIAAVNTTVHLRHCLIQHNQAAMNIGAARFWAGTVAILDTCLIDDNIANSGGWNGMVADSLSTLSLTGTTISNHTYPAFGATSGLRATGATVTMEACTLRNNSAWWGIEPIPYEGGAALMIRNPPSALIRNCIFEDNNGQYGGALLCSNARIEHCTFRRNLSADGGIFSLGGNRIVDCVFEDNKASLILYNLDWYYGNGLGGAIEFVFGVDSVLSCYFSGNHSTWAQPEGGPEYSFYAGTFYTNPSCAPYIANCVFVGNNMNQYDCYGSGSIMYNNHGNPVFEFCTMYDNDASGGQFDLGEWGTITTPGGVIISEGGSLTLRNCIISHSEATAAVRFVSSPLTDIGYCDFFGITGGNFAGDTPPNLGNISTVNTNGDSCDAFFNLLLDPAYIDAISGDFHLASTSPCLAAAEPLSTLNEDFEQNPRPNPSGSNPDIGAFESALGGLPAVGDLTIYFDVANLDILLNWTPVSGAASYNIYVGSEVGEFPSAFTLLGSTAGSSYVHDNALLLPDHLRAYVVTAISTP